MTAIFVHYTWGVKAYRGFKYWIPSISGPLSGNTLFSYLPTIFLFQSQKLVQYLSLWHSMSKLISSLKIRVKLEIRAGSGKMLHSMAHRVRRTAERRLCLGATSAHPTPLFPTKQQMRNAINTSCNRWCGIERSSRERNARRWRES